MTTYTMNASQLPIDSTPERVIWRVDINDYDLDFTLENGKITVEMNEIPFSEEDFQRDDLTSEVLSLSDGAEMAAPFIDGDFFNPNTGRYVGLFEAK